VTKIGMDIDAILTYFALTNNEKNGNLYNDGKKM